jgi:heme-degrading monooxygenase HmoA
VFVLHADLEAKPGLADALAVAYHDTFLPAIAAQPGFWEARLLRKRSPAFCSYRLVIVFETEALQRQWVATDLHKAAWTRMQSSIAGWSVNTFDMAGSLAGSQEAIAQEATTVDS